MDFITVVCKDTERSYSRKFHVDSLSTVTLSHDDPILQKLVKQAQDECKGVVQKIEIKSKFTW
jgi:hypothetical protein